MTPNPAITQAMRDMALANVFGIRQSVKAQMQAHDIFDPDQLPPEPEKNPALCGND